MGPQRLKELWENLAPQQQRMLVVLALVTVAAFIGLIYWEQRPNFAVLYSDLATPDAGEIVDYLRTHGYKYRLGAGGTLIEVDQGQKYALRLALAQEGLPKGSSGVGFEIFDGAGLPGSERMTRVKYQRALQGELERTITSLDTVRLSRVHVVLPEHSLYGGEQMASASVMVDTEGAQRLNARVVEGITHLVASAVQGLAPAAVTLIDARGNILSDSGGSGGGMTRKQVEASQEYERELQRKLQLMLDASLGKNMSIVQVQAELNFDEERLTSHLVKPSTEEAAGGLLQDRKTEETYSGAASRPGGVAGISSNLGAVTSAGGAEAGGQYEHSEEERTFEHGWEDRELLKAPGEVERLTVAVVIDDELPSGTEGQVSELLMAAAGIDELRGDQVVVERMTLAAKKQAEEDVKTAEQQQAAQRHSELTGTLLRYGVLLVLGAIIAAAVLMAAKQVRAGAPPAAPGEARPQQAQPAPLAGPAEPEAPQAEAEKRLDELAREDPEVFAQRIQDLMAHSSEEQ